jgi:hypothetical protein
MPLGQEKFHNLVVHGESPRGLGPGAKLAVTTSSGQTAAIDDAVSVDISCDAVCFILIGTNPTAIADTSYALMANVTYRLGINKGDKIAGITASGTANLWYHPVG